MSAAGVGNALDMSALARWKRDPCAFFDEMLVNPETDEPFVLLDSQRRFLEHAVKTDSAGRLLYPEQVWSARKKSGKTTFAGMNLLYWTLVHGGRYAEGICAANDLEQAEGRVFQAARRIVEHSPLLKCEAKITQGKIEFPATGATIIAIASDYASAAGANPTISTIDEAWAYTSERARRLCDELVPPPTRKIACRLTTTYAGFTGESELLEELYKRGLSQPLIGPDLYAGDGILMFWTHEPVAPWQTEAWHAQMRRTLRRNQYLRMIENRFVTTESEFIPLEWWDAITDPDQRPVVKDRSLSVHVGVDASFKNDSTAVAAVSWDAKSNKARLIWHRIFQPSPDDPLDFETTIEETIRDLHGRFRVREVRFDPWQMQATAQRLRAAGVKIEEFPQTVPNLTAASQNFYELVKGRNLSVYPDADIRRAIGQAVAIETTRGWRIGKDKQTHKIDVVVAMAMACLAAVATPKSTYTLDHVY
jgi:phage terminase large subunit-like protein